jgi:hypothetical protein
MKQMGSMEGMGEGGGMPDFGDDDGDDDDDDDIDELPGTSNRCTMRTNDD